MRLQPPDSDHQTPLIAGGPTNSAYQHMSTRIIKAAPTMGGSRSGQGKLQYDWWVFSLDFIAIESALTIHPVNRFDSGLHQQFKRRPITWGCRIFGLPATDELHLLDRQDVRVQHIPSFSDSPFVRCRSIYGVITSITRRVRLGTRHVIEFVLSISPLVFIAYARPFQ